MTKNKSLVFAVAIALFIICSSASAQNVSISIVSGNGQLICASCPTKPITTFNPLVVQVKDATGRPVPNATIAWTFTSIQSASGSLNSTTTTDANGQSQNTLFMNAALGSLFSFSYAQGAVTATVSALPPGTSGTTGQSVTFYETTALTDQQTNPGAGTGIVQLQNTLISPPIGTVVTGAAGSTNTTTPIQIRVAGLVGGGVPNVAVIVVPPADPTQPTISCATVPGSQPNTALTDQTGTATCNVLFGGRQGTGTAQVIVGQTTAPFDVFNVAFNVLPGVPGSVQVVTGNNQSGNAGATLLAPLVAVVGDQAGNPLSNVDVTWTVTQGSATLFNVRTVSDAVGRVSANVTLGSSPGAVVITVAVRNAPNVSATFTENVNLAVSAFQAVSGNNQSAAVSTAFSQPLVVQVLNNGAPVVGAAVNFAVTSGSATLSAASANTDSQGRAQVTVQAGPTAGNVTITASLASFTQTFVLTVNPPGPSLTSDSFKNAASGLSGAISPCSLANIVAQGLAPGLQGVIAAPLVGPLPLLVNNTTVAFSQPPAIPTNIFAPIWTVSNIGGQESMTIEVPCELSPGTATVTVNGPGGSKSINVQIQSAAPGIFETVGSDRRLRGVVIRPDGSFATRENPVRRGETAHMLVTGIGPVIPSIGTNQVGLPESDSVGNPDNLIVGIDNSGIQVIRATNARNLVGVYEVSFVVPADARTGDSIPLAFAVVVNGNLVFGNGSLIAIQ
jgi:uncharacterized protein (TIGR03437 family)